MHKFVHLLSLKSENVDLVELEVGETSPFADKCVADIELPDGVLLTAILRGGKAHARAQSTEILPGDYVLCLHRARRGEGADQGLPARRESRRSVQDEAELDTSRGVSEASRPGGDAPVPRGRS